MRNVAMRKLRSNEGASLMVALLFFVICAALGSIVLTSATVAAGRMTGMKKGNQSFYAVTSAAELFKTDWVIGNATFYTDDAGNVVLNDSPADIDSGDILYICNSLPEVRDVLAKQVYASGNTSTQEIDLLLTVNGFEGLNVNAVISMDVNYNTSITLSSNDENSAGRVIIQVTGSQGEPFVDDGHEYTVVGWANPVMIWR